MSGSDMSATLKAREAQRIAEKQRVEGLVADARAKGQAFREKGQALREGRASPAASAAYEQQFMFDYCNQLAALILSAMPPEAAFGVAVHLFAHLANFSDGFIPAEDVEVRRHFDLMRMCAREALQIANAKPIPTPPEFLDRVAWYAEMVAKGMPTLPWSLQAYVEMLLPGLAGTKVMVQPHLHERIMAATAVRERAAEIIAMTERHTASLGR